VAHFRQFFKTSGLLCRQRMTLNTLSSLVVEQAVLEMLLAAVRGATVQQQDYR